MNTKETCYLFFDFDGTVYLGGEHIPTENLEAMRRVQAMGHKLILHTGRSYGALFRSPCVFEVPWDGMILGAAEYHYEGRVIHRESVSYNEFLVWLDYAFEHRCKLAYEGRTDCHFLDFSEENPEALREQVLEHLPELKRVNPITKMTIFDYVLPGEAYTSQS